MNNSTININNYEAFLLDKIEGNLSPELILELTLFLNANDLSDVNEEDLVYLDENEFQDPISDVYFLSEDLKRYAPSISEEKLIFDSVEGNLERDSDTKLKAWIEKDPILKQHYSAMLSTRSTPVQSIVFPDKSLLKRREPVVRYLYMLAAACVLGLIFFFMPINTSNKDVQLTSVYKTSKHQIIEKNPNTEIIIKENTVPEINNITGLKNVNEIAATSESINNSITNGSSKGYLKHKVVVTPQIEHATADNISSHKEIDLDNILDTKSNIKNSVVLTNLPKIAKLGSERVMSNAPKLATINNYQNKRAQDDAPLLAGAVNSIRDKIDFVDKKSAAIYGFADFQKNIIQSEGLFEVSKDRNNEGKVEGYSFRIAGFEWSTAK